MKFISEIVNRIRIGNLDKQIETRTRTESLQRAWDWSFERHPDPYRYLRSPYEIRKHNRLMDVIQRLSRRPFRRVLEIGCAEGIFTERLAERSREIVAVDISSVGVDRARERLRGHPGATFHVGDIFQQQPHGPFDLILCAEVLYYDPTANFEKVERLASALVERLEPGGWLVLCNHFYAWLDGHSRKTRMIRTAFARQPALRAMQNCWRPFYLISVFSKS